VSIVSSDPILEIHSGDSDPILEIRDGAAKKDRQPKDHLHIAFEPARCAKAARVKRRSYGVVVNVLSLPNLVPPAFVATIRKWYVVWLANPLMLAVILR
jgi:hypothetical protein